MSSALGRRSATQLAVIAAKPPAAPPSAVFNVIRAISGPAVNVEPALKPNHPNHSKNVPSVAKIRFDGVKRRIEPSSPYLPTRGPITIAAANAIHPPTEWTIDEPAKSMKPSSASQPCWFGLSPPPQAQWPTTG